MDTMNSKIDPKIFSMYVNTLLRIGRADAPYWFVGLEEGGGSCENEIADRLDRWAKRGFPDIEFLSEGGVPNPNHTSKYLPKLKHKHKEGKRVRARLQRTWSNQLRIVLGIEGRSLNNEVIRKMQVSEHGTIDGSTSLLELYPLPCPNARKWIYGECGLGEEYSSKSVYRARLLLPRLELILADAAKYKPTAMVFTTWQQRHAIRKHVSGLNEIDIGIGKKPGKAMIGVRDGIVIVVCSHPADYFSNKNDFYWNLGRKIKELA
jgi:hypothetical protein